MTPTLDALNTRQTALQRKAGELALIYNTCSRGEFARWQPLAIEVFGNDAGDLPAVISKRDALFDEAVRRNFDEGLELIRTITLNAQRLFGAAHVTGQIMTSEAQTRAAETHQWLEIMAREKQFYFDRMAISAAVVACGDKKRYEELTAKLQDAAGARAPEVQFINRDNIKIDMPTLAMNIMHVQPEMTQAYQTVAEGICDAVRLKFAFVGAVSLSSIKIASRHWSQLAEQNNDLIKTARSYLSHAQREMDRVRHDEMPWVAGVRARMN